MAGDDKLERAIRALEAQRSALGDSVVDTATAELREKLAELRTLTSDHRQLVTVLFADVSGFTALSERLDPEEVQALLTRLWRRLDRVLVAHRGHIDKHIGDAVMCVWGLSGSSAEDATLAVRAALSMQRELIAFRSAENVDLSMRVGINTGLCSVSRVESTGEWNVIGDTVNLASRLEHAAEVGSVLIGSTTREHVRGRFRLLNVPPFAVKGKREPVSASVVEREIVRGETALTGITLPLLGRAAELLAIGEAYRLAAGGGLAWLTVRGAPGMGKSRLVDQALLDIARGGGRPRIVMLAATREMAAFGLIADLLRELAGSPFAPALVAALGESRGKEAAAYLGQLVGISNELEPLSHRPEQIRGRAEVLLTEYLASLSADRMLVLSIDDLHWADSGSFGFLTRLAQVGLPRCLLLTTERPSERRSSAQAVELGPLDTESLSRLAHKLGAPTPEHLRFLIRRSDGNPAFLRELARFAAERPLDELETLVPPRIEQLLHERIARLPPSARAVLGVLSVTGPRAEPSAVATCLDAAPSEADLELLALQGLLDRGEGLSLTSELLSTVAYEFSLLRERKVWHERLARRLAVTDGSDPATVARHFDRAGASSEATDWYLVAAERARRADAFEEAETAFSRALTLLEEAPPASPQRGHALRNRCLLGLGQMLEGKARYDEAADKLEQALAAARLAGDALAQAKTENAAAWVASQRGDHTRAESIASRAEAIARSALAGPSPEDAAALTTQLAEALHNRGWARTLLGDGDGALTLGREALAVAEGGATPRARALALNLIGVAHYHLLGRFDEGARHQEAALALYRRIGDRWGIACQLNNLGDLELERGNPSAALTLLQAGLDEIRQIGHRGQEVVLLGNLARVRLAQGDAAGALATADEALNMADGFSLSESWRTSSEAALALGDREGAVTRARRALEHAGGDDADRALALRALAGALGEHPEAEACFARALSLFVRLGRKAEQIATYEAWAAHEARLGAHDRHAELLQEASRVRGTLG